MFPSCQSTNSENYCRFDKYLKYYTYRSKQTVLRGLLFMKFRFVKAKFFLPFIHCRKHIVFVDALLKIFEDWLKYMSINVKFYNLC